MPAFPYTGTHLGLLPPYLQGIALSQEMLRDETKNYIMGKSGE